MKRLSLTICAVMLAIVGWATAGENYTVIISLDGFRWDYPEAFDTPFLNQMGDNGVKAVMTPSFPSKTFPNHYTLATGLYPDHHGIINNTFVERETGRVFSLGNMETRSDPHFFGGDPIWLTAERQGVTAATVFWVGSDVAIQGQHATYWHDYVTEAKNFSQASRCDEVVRLLSLPESERPRLVMAYFEEPDASGHKNGPICRKTRRALERIDLLLEDMWHRIQKLPIGNQVNLIVTGDHGMASLSQERVISPWDYLKREWVDRLDNDFPVLINATQPKYVDNIYRALKDVDHIRVWKRGELPTYLNYGNNKNMSDIIVLPDVGWYFSDKKPKDKGSHGFDHTCSDMWVAFRAVGPDFKQGYTHPHTFRNVCVYPLLCHLLGITPSPNDGTIDEVRDLLR